LLYLAIIVTSILSLFLVEARLIVDGDWATTTQRIAADQTLFRAGLVYDMVMFASVIALAWALFVVLRGVDRNRALLALLWRMAEAVVGAVTVLLGVLVALLVDSQDARAAFEPAQLHALVDVLLTARAIGFDVVVFFLSLGTIVYCRLLYRSRYVPRALAGLGIVAFRDHAGGHRRGPAAAPAPGPDHGRLGPRHRVRSRDRRVAAPEGRSRGTSRRRGASRRPSGRDRQRQVRKAPLRSRPSRA
jgi:Domain of unknown function (DUF4386)